MKLIPPVPVLQQRLAAVEAQIADCDQKLNSANGLARQRLEVARAALDRRRLWYVRRLRGAAASEPLGVHVADTVQTHDAHA